MERRTVRLFVLLGGVHVAMLLVGRFLLISSPVLLWSWFAVSVVAGAVGAAVVGGLGVARGLGGAAAFLLGWVAVGPLVVSAFSHVLPERPVILGVALASQLMVLLPSAGSAWTWRLLVPLATDIGVSAALGERRPPGVAGVGSVVLTLLVVGALEVRFGPGEPGDT